MLLYYPFWMFMGFTLHISIIFGTNLLTGGPARIDVFCLFQYFEEKESQTESKRNETFGSDLFGTNAIQRTWSGSQETSEAATRVEGAPTLTGRAGHPRGHLFASLTSTPSLLGCVCSKKIAPEGFIPFGLRLIFFPPIY